MRKTNSKCKICGKEVYKRPKEIEQYKDNLYCCRGCMFKDRAKYSACQYCNVVFIHPRKNQKYCDKSCSGKATRNRTGTKTHVRKQKNKTEKNLSILKEKFNFNHCMIKGCYYNKCYDVHRLIAGKDGGKYEIGNMFAICPNHHAEYHRKLIELVKIDDCTLEIR